MTQVNPLIPTQSQTQLPSGDFRAPTGVVEGNSPLPPQPGTRMTPRTPSGSGVYGAPGSLQPLVQPVRDYVVILKNVSDRDFRMRYLTVEYRIAAHDELVVQWEVMVSFLGSPETMNLGPRRMDRKNAYDKLRVKYGAYYDDALWEQNRPPLEAYRITGDRLTTIVDDPDGLTVTPSAISQSQQMATVAAMQQMQQQMDALNRIIAQMSGHAQSTGDQSIPQSDQGQDVPTDAPLAPDYVPGGVAQHPIPPVQVPPTPVPGMTPQMPIQPVQMPPQTFTDENVNVNAQPQGATPDTPANSIRIG